MRPPLMLRDMSTWRRKKSTFSPAGTIGMPMWLGRTRRRAAPRTSPAVRRRTPLPCLPAARGTGRQAAAEPDDEEAGLDSPVLDRSAPQHRLDALGVQAGRSVSCLLYTSDAADDLLCVDLGGRRIIQKKK